MSDRKKEIDEISGTETTGHNWDGLKELNTPLPRWWILTFYATVIWSLGYFLVYPAWPTLNGYTKGIWDWSSRNAVTRAVADAEAKKAPLFKALLEADLETIKSDEKLLEFAMRSGKASFGDNCAPCHGSGATGSKGYPNLNDDDWLWGGSLEAIAETIRIGIRSTHEDTRANDMTAFGTDEILDKTQIRNVAGYVLSLSGRSLDGSDIAAGKEIFTENCVACHGEKAEGMQELGGPNLSDDLWLFGSDAKTIIKTITEGRKTIMPHWEGRLSPATIKALAVYVHSLGGGQ